MFLPLNSKTEQSLEAQAREERLSGYIPYCVPVDEHTIKTFDGDFLQVIRLHGLPFETAEKIDINLRKRIRNQLWKTLNSSNYAVYHHIVRRERTVLPEGSFAPGFAQDLNERWKGQLRARRQYTNDIYLTLVYKRGEGAVKKFAHLYTAFSHKADSDERERYEALAIKDLYNFSRSVLEIFKVYWPEKLGVRPNETGYALCDHMRFLGYLINLSDREYLLPERPINQILGHSRVLFNHETIEIRQPTRTLYAGMLSVKEYDSITAPNMFDKMLSLPMEFVMAQSFRFEERILTEFAIERQQGRLRNTRDKGLKQILALEDAMEETKGDSSFGMHHQTMLVWDETPRGLIDKIAAADAEFAEQGITCVREDVNLEAAFFAQLPGNFRFITRGARTSTRNFASFASCHNYVTGRSKSHWGPAVTVLPTMSSTPYYMNFHVADRGNTLVLGPTGQGKTLTLAFLFAQSLKLGGKRVFLDKDRGMEIFVRAVGGRYFRIEGGRRTNWNPLQLPDSPAVRSFLNDWFEALLSDPGGDRLTSDDRTRIRTIVQSIFDMPAEHRVLRHVAPMFGSAEEDRLARRLLEWYDHPRHGEGRYAWMFDNDTNQLDIDCDVVGFDLTYVLDAPRSRTAAVMWLFFVIESMLDGKPMAMFADEGWRLLQDELMMKRLENFEFVIRKNNGLLAFATQTPETVMRSSIAPALKQQSETLILFPNPKAEEDVYCGYLGLNNTQFQLIKKVLPERGEPGWFLVINSLGASICRLDMTGMDDQIAILSGNKNTVGLLDTLLEQHGEDPKDWLPHFVRLWRSARPVAPSDN